MRDMRFFTHPDAGETKARAVHMPDMFVLGALLDGVKQEANQKGMMASSIISGFGAGMKSWHCKASENVSDAFTALRLVCGPEKGRAANQVEVRQVSRF